MQHETLDRLRADFDLRSKGSMSLPIAGAIVWSVVAVLGWLLQPGPAILALVISTGAIFPLGLAIAKARGERLLDSGNPLAKLMGTCVFMVNLLWALHVPLLMRAPEFVPLSLGISLGLHWMVYSWIIGHPPLGYRHAILRTAALVAVWFALPDHRLSACAIVVVFAYMVTLVEMRSRLANSSSNPTPPRGAL